MASENYDALLTAEEAADRLGTGVRFTRRLIAERRIRFVRVGRHVRIPVSAVAEMVELGTVLPADRSRGR
jgi:excisionase family DNA binding protein